MNIRYFDTEDELIGLYYFTPNRLYTFDWQRVTCASVEYLGSHNQLAIHQLTLSICIFSATSVQLDCSSSVDFQVIILFAR